jgi:hypothetical protein
MYPCQYLKTIFSVICNKNLNRKEKIRFFYFQESLIKKFIEVRFKREIKTTKEVSIEKFLD